MAAARKRMDAGRAREAAGRGFAEANAGMTRTSEAEKTFTSQVRDSFICTWKSGLSAKSKNPLNLKF